ncbi:MAG: Na(+)-translocating NADH-quinone reductase subunit C [Myxococcales bacterium]|nr:MAG: Na(+)-translocating NADH-quinone reductase subunit C [Myxococcales bacterium]
MPEIPKQPSVKRESVTRTLLVAFFVSLVCSSLVASAAVVLKPRQIANALLDVRKNILEVAGLLQPEGDVNELFAAVEPRVIDLETGAYLDDVDPEGFDPVQTRKDPKLSVVIPAELDIARIGRRSKRAVVYLVRDQGEITRIILPVSGYGLWSTLYGFLALEPDGNTVADIIFYSHGETAGIGDFLTKEPWRARWPGKRVYDDAGELRLEVSKGRVAADDPLAAYRVDGVSGATLTGNGVTNLIRYWLGDHGYGPFLKNIQGGGS